MTERVLHAMRLIQQTMSNPTSCSTSRSRSLRGESPHPQSRTSTETLDHDVSASSADTQPYEEASSLADTEPYEDVASSRSRTPPREGSRTPKHPTVDQEGFHSQTASSSQAASSSLHQPLLPEALAQDSDHETTDEDEEVTKLDLKVPKHYWLNEADPDEGDPETGRLEEHIYHFERIRASRWPPKVLGPSTVDPSLVTKLRPEPAQSASILFEGVAARSHIGLGYMVSPEETIETSYFPETGAQTSLIVKAFDNLSAADVKENWHVVKIKRLQELRDLFDLGCYKRMPRSRAKNVADVKWVDKLKMTNGQRDVKSRVTMRGFKDRAGQDLAAFAGTASRWGQRLVNSTIAQNTEFEFFSFDVSAAFAKGMTFRELADLTGETLREVQFDLDAMSSELLRPLPEFRNFDPATETLSMVKPIYGLKDAPRAWQQKLNIILIRFGMKPLLADEQAFVLFQTLVKKPKLLCILSTHADDLKGGAKKAVALALLAHIEKAAGKFKQGWTVFTHTGIEHIHIPGEVYAHQQAYLNQLKPLDTALFRGRPEEDLLSEAHTSLYMSLRTARSRVDDSDHAELTF